MPFESRKQEEVNFANQRELDRQHLNKFEFEEKYSNKKFYSVTQAGTRYFSQVLTKHTPGKVTLDYGCGLGGMSLRLAQGGALVYGIDISDQSVRSARQNLVEAGFEDNCVFQVMDAENLAFPDKMFDLIVCSGVLHHLYLLAAYRELSRVVKDDGIVLCIEALGHNPVINLYRKVTPHLRTSWEAEHILTMSDIRAAGQYFDTINQKFFYLMVLMAIPLRKMPFFNSLVNILTGLDKFLLKLPLLKLLAWQTIFILSKSKSSPVKIESNSNQ